MERNSFSIVECRSLFSSLLLPFSGPPQTFSLSNLREGRTWGKGQEELDDETMTKPIHIPDNFGNTTYRQTRERGNGRNSTNFVRLYAVSYRREDAQSNQRFDSSESIRVTILPKTRTLVSDCTLCRSIRGRFWRCVELDQEYQPALKLPGIFNLQLNCIVISIHSFNNTLWKSKYVCLFYECASRVQTHTKSSSMECHPPFRLLVMISSRTRGQCHY
jgi:hypothetical protein